MQQLVDGLFNKFAATRPKYDSLVRLVKVRYTGNNPDYVTNFENAAKDVEDLAVTTADFLAFHFLQDLPENILVRQLETIDKGYKLYRIQLKDHNRPPIRYRSKCSTVLEIPQYGNHRQKRRKYDLSKTVCHKCNKTGHIAKYCRQNNDSSKYYKGSSNK
ncbi:hypothetical protein TBLA_0D03240 [Henningerozyma blattae CBS 6284]|uniref:CCHC-type domain-containing protein n=1 Tax=Henningerozyma blattae (strain ATCC 34711 / CBS 6284 / DSM 70876 / NBRC 10599 / NRRL Y-10934 / UCD 77-7) TaxID=1071380 RepID=I2H372_HENB6|nr:hypothetical protein TBLA_0D03240 [Tetrapisispora blattae CBS 6284]CCH60824.1 hypothetical protein TBLA_0D03240 [Tetrapisispora blattae CBS 6284]